MDTPTEQPVYRVYHCSRCGEPFRWDEEAEQAQAPDLCEACQPEQPAVLILSGVSSEPEDDLAALTLSAPEQE